MIRNSFVAFLCLAISGCLITTPRTQVIVSRASQSDEARIRRVCAIVAARNGLELVPFDRRGYSLPSEKIDEYGKPVRTYRTLLSGRLDYTGPTMLVSDSSTSVVVTIAEWSGSKARSKLADDVAAALQKEFGVNRAQRRDDRWTEF